MKKWLGMSNLRDLGYLKFGSMLGHFDGPYLLGQNSINLSFKLSFWLIFDPQLFLPVTLSAGSLVNALLSAAGVLV
jgi:hypothetical protein